VDSETELTDIAVDLLRALMRSVSTDRVRPVDWWVRARSALETGAATADSWGHMVSRMGRKLEVDAFRRSTSDDLVRLAARLGDRFAAFRELCQRDALFIAAMAQAKNQEQSS
jgi:hypothetical protein